MFSIKHEPKPGFHDDAMGKEAQMLSAKQGQRLGYREDAMEKSICLICGERPGEYEFRGKTVCPVCIESIRKNY